MEAQPIQSSEPSERKIELGGRRKWLLILALLVVLGLLSGILYGLLAGLPDPQTIGARLNMPSVRIVDRQGRLLYDALDASGGRHVVLPLSVIPLALQQATIATEDSRFYSNPGIDLLAILRSLWINLRGGETLTGGSTITQQVARNLLMNSSERSEQSLRRKLRESILAWRLAQVYPKDQILALYLNQMNYGGLAYGVEAAAQTYFGKPAAQLDLAECTLLAGLPQAPARYNPYTDSQAAKKRQKVVLELMEKQGFISAEQHALAGREPLRYASVPYPIEAPHFIMMVRAQLDGMFSQQSIYDSGGLVVHTTLDLDWQQVAQRAVERQIEALKTSEDGLGHNVNSAALVALDPGSGAVRALVGSPDYFDSAHAGAINMAVAPRQPGSALKPLVYAEAFDPARSFPWTAATMLLDVSTSFVTHDEMAYTPANYDNKEHGPVLARQALASSLNIPAVLTLKHVGLTDLFNLASALGITTLNNPDDYDLSLALGGGEVRLLELTAAYAALDAGGVKVTPYLIDQIEDLRGNVLFKAVPAARPRILDERVAWLISDILSDNDARRLGFGPNSILRLDRPAAVKTGTTTNFHDNWTVGYTPDLVVGVWAGNSDYQPMRGVTGLTGAAPIWHQFMRSVLAGHPARQFTRPYGLTQVEICALSGELPSPACPYHQQEWFINGTQPTQVDHLYHTVTLDRDTGRLADAATPPERRQVRQALDLPLPAQTWAHNQGLLLWSEVQPAVSSAGQLAASAEPIRLVSPAPNTIFKIAPGFDAATQRIHLQAVGTAGLVEVRLYLDGAIVARLPAAPYDAWVPLTPGNHQAWAEAVLPGGETVTTQRVHFEVH